MEINKPVLCIKSLFNIGLKVFFLGNGKLLSTLIVLSYLIAIPNISLAKSKCDKWYSGSYSDTILWGRGSLQEIADCVKKVGLNHRDYVGSTPLHSAIIHHNPRIENVKYLLGRGAEVNTYRRMLGWQSSPLISMAVKGDYSESQQKQSEIILLLIKHGADLDAKDEKGRTALQLYGGHDAQVIAALNGSGSTVFKQDTAADNTCSANPNLCTLTELCTKTSRGSRKHIALAQKSGLNCGVVETAAVIPEKTSVTKTCTSKTPEACSNTYICNAATFSNVNSRAWKKGFQAYVKEAKRRGLTCGIEIANFDKSDFLNLSSLNRKQLQYGLKKLSYYTSSIDGLYGPNTQRAVRGYAAAKGITSGYPASVYNRIIREVNVPSSFAVARRPSTSSSSSSSSSSGVSDANKTLLGGLFIAGVCALTPDVGACLDGAMGNSPSTSSGSVPKISSNSCTSNSSCPSSRQVCIKKAGRGVCMKIPRGSTRYDFEAIKCSGSFDCPSRSKCDRTYKICVKR